MSDLSSVKALVFDVFGTVVDWRTSLITDLTWWGKGRGISADWTALVDGWRGMYTAAMDDVRKHPNVAMSSSTSCTAARWTSWSRSSRSRV
ncbi:FMN phosphatase YigB (HAD superfamily) [Bradyrhizobium sp. RT4b]